MKYVWEESDVKGGLRVRKADGTGKTVMIGYTDDAADRAYFLVSLSDGLSMVDRVPRSQLADILNNRQYIPEPLDRGT